MILDLWARLRQDKMRAYRVVFYDNDGKLTPEAEIIISDLKKFCRADRSTHTVGGSPTDMAVAEGRREVWLRLMSFLHLDESIFYQLKEEIHDDGTVRTRTAESGKSGEPDFY